MRRKGPGSHCQLAITITRSSSRLRPRAKACELHAESCSFRLTMLVRRSTRLLVASKGHKTLKDISSGRCHQRSPDFVAKLISGTMSRSLSRDPLSTKRITEMYLRLLRQVDPLTNCNRKSTSSFCRLNHLGRRQTGGNLMPEDNINSHLQSRRPKAQKSHRIPLRRRQ